ncbi:uncharacterized protein B0I36DRAFT_370828 [Microdochium trichocladiopsis]|uniref:PRISE-like Rossmann-fold domain-containing protein n=1 Tax=Microdochium trichocladiopsis TaxID=1682393 RepID=A0A9P9BVL9_9PEZI|nr:uncharacterized protein B0I36DRAFT_370828 [Microdochium trichocladiopsis]KAH7039882.1 hypothetical protein B0I36DRAFT_370828 [Microdochium trichocladiopsis]
MAGNKTALIFGASGVTGWAMVNEILNDYPKKGIWNKVYALTNRPLSREASCWPNDTRLDIVSGVDLLQGSQEELEQVMKDKIKGFGNVTHVIYLAYKAQADIPGELEENIAMFKRAITAVDRLSPALEFVVLQTGAKTYGCHLLDAHPADEHIHVPLKETMPRLQQPYHDQLFYYPQLDWLTEFSRGKKWGWNDTRPDIIVGFVPNQNFYSLGSALGVYLSLWREKFGEGADAPYPGSTKAYNARSIDSSADMIARQTLHVMLTEPWSTRQGEAWNVADARTPSTWKEKWPVMCAYFGLKGTKAAEDNPVEVRTFIKENMDLWAKMEKKYGLQSGHADSERIFKGFEYFLLTLFNFDRQYDMTKMYDEAGFTEERTTKQTWGGVWDRMRAAKIIPASFS